MLHFIFAFLAALGTAGAYLIDGSISLWWIPVFFVGEYVGITLLYLILLLIASFFLPTKKPIKTPSEFCRFMIWITMDWVMTILRIHVTVKGEEKIPNEPCVLVCNHQSDFDPMTVLAVMRKRRIAYISKESNFKIPIVGPFIFHAGFLSIDRNNGIRAMRTLHTAAARMKETGVDIGIYPEGTRSRTGKLLRFKAGAYVLAKEADAPIVVMSTKGTDGVTKRKFWKKLNVQIEILDVISREEVREMTTDELTVKSKEMIEISLFGAVQSKEEPKENA